MGVIADKPEVASPDGEGTRNVPVIRQRYARRLSDKIIIAFHSACDIGDHETAASLLRVAENVLKRSHQLQDRRRNVESLVAAHYRLWALMHEVNGDPLTQTPTFLSPARALQQ